MTQLIRLDLLTNALDSIAYTIDLLAWKDIQSDQRRMKFAILGIAQAVELLLKERLRQIDPALVFEDSKGSHTYDKRTVSVDETLKRLGQHGNFHLRSEDRALIRDLRRTRNAVEHGQWNTTILEAKSIIGPALSFAVEFARTELNRDLSYELRGDSTWEQLLSELAEFAQAHARRLAVHAGEDPASLMTCTRCHHESLTRLDSSCPLCGHWGEDQLPPP